MHCGDCRFWHQPATQCRRNAPQPNGSKQASSDTAWPHVAADDWCGEYQPGYIDRTTMPAEAQKQSAQQQSGQKQSGQKQPAQH